LLTKMQFPHDAAKAEKNAKTNFMAPGYPNPQVGYGPQVAAAANV
jgi:NADH dehydrogenase (ubiquinone) Fe-S protein 1